MAAYDLVTRLANLQKNWRNIQPSIPVAVAVCEGHQLYGVVNLRRAAFTLPGFDSGYIDALPVLATRLDECESAWKQARRGVLSATLRPVREEAEKFRSELIASARYLLRSTEDAQLQLDQIAEGSGIEDLVSDLREIARFGETYASILGTDRNLPPALPAYARSLADKLSTVNESPEARAALELRNQIFFLLEEAMSEVRAAGRFIYRNEPETLAMMSSEYARRKKRRHREGKDSNTQPAPTK